MYDYYHNNRYYGNLNYCPSYLNEEQLKNTIINNSIDKTNIEKFTKVIDTIYMNECKRQLDFFKNHYIN